jgi:predicted transcriptional regulator
MNQPSIQTVSVEAVDRIRTGSLLRQYRVNMGVTQLELARELGNQYSANVSSSESGRRHWDKRKLEQYIAAIDRAARKKLSGSTKQPPEKQKE